MRFENDYLRKLTGLAVTATVRSWMSTLDIAGHLCDPTNDPASPDFRGPAIFVLWHEYIPVPFYLRPRGRMALLVSRHADAEWLTQTARYSGLETVRGSTGRGGTAALLEMLHGDRRRNLAVTPDGPRGPRRQMSMGAVFLASQSGWPIILLASGYDRPWRLPTWDRFAIPRPYSRCRAIISSKIYVPADLDRAELEAHRRSIERRMLDLTDAAERWAESGRRWPGQLAGTVKRATSRWPDDPPPSDRSTRRSPETNRDGRSEPSVAVQAESDESAECEAGKWRQSA